MPGEQPAVERHEFAVSTEECLEQQTLFVSQPYLLHYNLYVQFVDDAELSEGVVKSRGPAYCYHENLRDCVAGRCWRRARPIRSSSW